MKSLFTLEERQKAEKGFTDFNVQYRSLKPLESERNSQAKFKQLESEAIVEEFGKLIMKKEVAEIELANKDMEEVEI